MTDIAITDMSMVELPKDYRKLDADNPFYTLSQRLVNPVLRLDWQNGFYIAVCGAKVKCNGKIVFIACHSNEHNWILDGSKIKPLPWDTPAVITEVLGDTSRLSFSQLLSLIRQGSEKIEIDVSPEVFKTANHSAEQRFIPTQITGLNATLYPYQSHGVAWMSDMLDTTGGVILADEMGLGKTLQMIALFLVKGLHHHNPALIVCPTTLMANWCLEISKFAPGLTFLTHRGTDRTGFYKDLMRSQIVITTYDTLVNDISLFCGIDWDFVVCDEAQAVKNPQAIRRKAIARLPRKYTIPVTGTPMENSLLDLWSLTDLAIPGMLGEQQDFSLFYPDTEEGALALSTVADIIILKRQIKDVADDLPLRTDIDFPIEANAAAMLEYEKIKIQAIAEYGPAGKLVAVGQLAIYCAHPWLRVKDMRHENWEDNIELIPNPAYPLITPKMEVCLRLLKQAFLSGKKVLIFAVYNHCGELIQTAAAQQQLPDVYWNTINGATPQVERQAIVDEFSQHQGAAVLILNPKAAGAGLNITAATVVIHYTQNWNPALEIQASARAHRRGQTLPVTIYRLYYQDTVEEMMVQRSRWKRDLSHIAVPVSTRDKQDLAKVLSIK